METLEIPAAEDVEPIAGWSDQPPVKFEEQDMDIAAFELWRMASLPDAVE